VPNPRAGRAPRSISLRRPRTSSSRGGKNSPAGQAVEPPSADAPAPANDASLTIAATAAEQVAVQKAIVYKLDAILSGLKNNK